MKILLATTLPSELSACAAAVARALEDSHHEVDTRDGGDRAAPQLLQTLLDSRAAVHRYDLAGGQASTVFGAEAPEPYGVLVVVCTPGEAAGVPRFVQTSLLGPVREPVMGQHVEDGPRLERFRESIEEFLLRDLGPKRFLCDFRWRPELRLRPEEFGGLLFVPATSLLMQLDHDDFRRVGEAIAANDTALLADDQGGRLSAGLYRVGALVRGEAMQ